MPTDTRSFPATQPIDPPTSARTRVLEGGLPTRPQAARPAASAPPPSIRNKTAASPIVSTPRFANSAGRARTASQAATMVVGTTTSQ